MNFVESIPIALFCFAMVILVLTTLFLLIKLFSYTISLGNKTYNNLILKKDIKKRTGLDDGKNNDTIFTTVTDEQGNVRSFNLKIESVKENKK